MSITGRLAPSPTGHLHLGHARSFLLAWWSARAAGGRVVLRIEDLDAPRADPSWVDAARRDLEWLGLDWDVERLQSESLPRLEQAVLRLCAQGDAYACTCSRADIQRAQSAPQAGDPTSRYPGTCRGRYQNAAQAARLSGKPAGIRFRTPTGVVRFIDRVAGAQAFDVASSVGDFLVAKRDGAPAYQLAVVVDDHADGITEVVRGDDLLESTARQLLLHSALGLPPPNYLHPPLVLDADGVRLAKRRDSLSLTTLREHGVRAEHIVGWVAESAGLFPEPLAAAPRSQAQAQELTRVFSWEKLPRHPVVLTEAALGRLLE